MSRALPFDGFELQRGPAALWTWVSKTVIMPAFPTRVQLYPPPGPVLAEWFMINADIQNDDLVAIGGGNVTYPGTVGMQSITTLSPGEWMAFEPNDKGLKTTDGALTAPDGDVVFMQLIEEWDLVDVTQFWATPGNLGVTNGQALQCSIGNRSRR